MAKGLGIAALAIMILSFPMPIVGTWVGYIAMLVAAVSALLGHKTLVWATAIIGAIKMYFMSPWLMATMYAPFFAGNGNPVPLSAFFFLFLTTAFVALPLAALIFRSSFLDLGKQIGLIK